MRRLQQRIELHKPNYLNDGYSVIQFVTNKICNVIFELLKPIFQPKITATVKNNAPNRIKPGFSTAAVLFLKRVRHFEVVYYLLMHVLNK